MRWSDKDLDALKSTVSVSGMEIAVFDNSDGSLVDPSKREDFIDETQDSIDASVELNCKNLIVEVGQENPDLSRSRQHKYIVDLLKEIVPYAEDKGATLIVEPLNILVNHKGIISPQPNRV